MQQSCTFGNRFWSLEMQFIFQTAQHKKITGTQIWRLRRPIHAASRILAILRGYDMVIKMFIEKIKDFRSSMWKRTFLNGSERHFVLFGNLKFYRIDLLIFQVECTKRCFSIAYWFYVFYFSKWTHLFWDIFAYIHAPSFLFHKYCLFLLKWW